jgi:hypothetical protein
MKELATIDWNVLDGRRLLPTARTPTRGGGPPRDAR